MGTPLSAKKVGTIDKSRKIYIEDYVVSYLKDKKCQAIETPVRAALYGYAEKKQDAEKFIIYGAVCAEDETMHEELRREFFDGYDLIGYVNIHGDGQDNKNAGYHIFFDDNEAMQEYLLYCDATNKRSIIEHEIMKEKHKKPQVREGVHYKHETTPVFGGILRKIKILLIGGFCIIGAIAVTTIDDYQKMRDFSGAVMQVLTAIENQDEKILFP